MNATDWMPLFDTVANMAIAALVQCTAATALALMLAAVLRRRAAARQLVLRSTVICVLCCPVVSLAARCAGINWPSLSREPSPSTASRNGAAETYHPPADRFDEIAIIEARDIRSESEKVAALAPPSDNPAVLWKVPPPIPEIARTDKPAGIAPKSAVLEFDRRALFVGLILWAAGTTACLLGIARGFSKLRKVIRNATIPDCPSLRPLLESLCQEFASARVPRLLCSRAAKRPMSAGIVRPAIILPAGFTRRLNTDDVRCVLLHELAHVLRRDHALLWAEQLMLACFWFHPLVHWLKRQSERAREETCDNFVLNRIDRVRYSDTLLRVARLFPSNSLLIGGAGLLDKRWSLEERISGLLEERRNTMTRVNLFTSSAFLLVLAATLTLLGAATWAAPRGETPSPDSHNEGDATNAATDSAPAGLRVGVPAASSAGVPDIEWGDDSNFSFYVGFARENADEQADQDVHFHDPATPARRYLSASQAGRVAYVDIEKVFDNSSAFKKRRAKLKEAVESVSREQKTAHEQVKALHQAVRAISDDHDAKAELKGLIDAKTMEIEQKTAKTRAEFLDREAAMYYEFYQVITAAIGKHAAENGIDVVLRRKSQDDTTVRKSGPQQAASGRDVLKIIHQPILYIRDDNDARQDITDDIIGRVEGNAKY